MKLGRSLLAIVAVCFAGVVLPRSAAADEWDKRTILTFSQAVEIPGKVLPAGTCVFQLAESAASRHVVQVSDQDGRILATVLTIPTVRLTAADDTRITFEKQRAGDPCPIKKWLYPGALGGEEFIYGAHAPSTHRTEHDAAFEEAIWRGSSRNHFGDRNLNVPRCERLTLRLQHRAHQECPGPPGHIRGLHSCSARWRSRVSRLLFGRLCTVAS